MVAAMIFDISKIKYIRKIDTSIIPLNQT